MRSLVTGGSGWIGSNLVKKLEQEGDEVFNYDLKENYDITNVKQLNDVFYDFRPDRVFHLAAQAFLRPGEEHPYLDVDVNIKGMINILTCLEKYKVPMVYTSSGAVYGTTLEVPHREESPCQPMSNYGISKLAAEHYLKKWVRTKGIDARILRFSSVYGPGRKHGPVNIFINKALTGLPLTVYGDGSQTRDLTYISDALRGTKIVLKNGLPGEVYNIGSGVETSVKEVAEIVSSLTGSEIIYVEHEFSDFDLKRSYYDLLKSSSIGYEPTIDLREGIKELLEYEKK